jgi:cytochrome c-type biogenesis protein CcmH
VRALAAALVALALAAPALASEQRPTLADLEDELVCPTCQTTLDQSSAPVAERMRAVIRARIAAGDSKSEIKRRLVAEFGEQVLAAPPRRGFNLLAWVAPLAGLALGGAVLTLLAWRWSRGRDPVPTPLQDRSRNGSGALDPALERRLDEELARFES